MNEIDHIIAGVDGSAGGDRALRWAVAEAARRDVPVTALLAWSYLDQRPLPGQDVFDPHYDERSALATLDAYVRRAVPAPPVSVARKVVCDLPARALLDAAGPRDLLVVGGRGLGGFRGLLLGSVSRRCAHEATGSVVVVRDEPDHAAGAPVLVGVDGSEASAAALAWAADDARARQVPLQVLNAWRETSVGLPPYAVAPGMELTEKHAQFLIEDMIEAARADDVAEPVMVRGGAASALVDASRGAALVVVGTHGHGPLHWLLGSVADQVAHHAHCPVVLVRPQPTIEEES